MMRAHNLVVSFYVWYKILGFNISRERSLSDNNEKSPFSYMCVDVYIKKNISDARRTTPIRLAKDRAWTKES